MEHAALDQRPAKARSKTRSRVTNGHLHGGKVDGRSAGARRFRDLVVALTADIGGDVVSITETSLIRQAATLLLRTEQLQLSVARAEPVNSDELIRLAGESRRIMATLSKRARPERAPSLAEHLAAHEDDGA